MARGGPRAGAGRPRGAKNKLPQESRAYVLAVANQLEKEGKGMLEWARENPDDFWGRVYRAVIPKEAKIEHTGKLSIVFKRAPK